MKRARVRRVSSTRLHCTVTITALTLVVARITGHTVGSEVANGGGHLDSNIFLVVTVVTPLVVGLSSAGRSGEDGGDSAGGTSGSRRSPLGGARTVCGCVGSVGEFKLATGASAERTAVDLGRRIDYQQGRHARVPRCRESPLEDRWNAGFAPHERLSKSRGRQAAAEYPQSGTGRTADSGSRQTP